MKTNSTDIKTLKVIAGTVILLIVLLLTLGCSKETQTVTVQVDNSRVEQLERSLQLNFQNDALLAARVTTLEASRSRFDELQLQINQLTASMNSADNTQQQAIQQQIANYNAMQNQINNMQTLMNSSVSQLSVTVNNYINNSNTSNQALDALNASITNLTNRITYLENNVATDQELQDLRLYINNNFATIAMFNSLTNTVNNLNTQIVNINNSVTNLQTIVNNGSGTTMVKAPCSNAKEYFLKTNGKYYAAMNIYGQCDDLDKVYLAELAINVTYVTTDGTACRFKVLSNGTLQQQ